MLPLLQSLLKSTTSPYTSRKYRRRRHASRESTQVQALEDRVLLAGIVTDEDIVVRSGDAAPDVSESDGTFSVFSTSGSVINDAGQVLFYSTIITNSANNYSTAGLFKTTSSGTSLVARTNQDIPQIAGAKFNNPGVGNGSSGARILPFNENGQAVFVNENAQGVSQTSGFFAGSGTVSSLKLISKEGDNAPASSGSNAKFARIDSNNEAAINNPGQVAFWQALDGTDNGVNDNTGIFRGDASGSVIEIVQKGQTIPGASGGTFTAFSNPSINDAGQVAFIGENNNTDQLDGIYVGDGTTLRTVAQEGAIFNANSDSFYNILGVAAAINVNGDVAFKAAVDDGEVGVKPTAVFVRRGNGTLREVARAIGSLGSDIAINNNGDVAFIVDQTTGNDKLYRGDANGSIILIAEAGQTVSGGGAIASVRRLTLNDSGQMAFTVWLDTTGNGGGDTKALFLYDNVLGLTEIVRVGDIIDELDITNIYFAGTSSGSYIYLPSNRDGLNNKGQVTFSYDLANEGGFVVQRGVAVVSVIDRSIPASSSIAGFVNGNWWVSSPDASGNYTTSQWASGQTSPVKVLKGDFNGDGLQDVAAWLPNGEWQVGLANSVDKTFTFQKWTKWRTNDIKEIQVGDFNGDGRDDIAGLFKRGSRGDWWVAQSDGTRFVATKWGTYGNYNGIATVVTGDFDGTSPRRDDIAVMASNGRWWIYTSQGSSFNVSSWTKWKITSGVNNILVGDFDGDGKDDIAGLFGTGTYRNWWIGLSTGSSFANRKWSTWKVSISLDGVVAGDFNGDGATDIAGLFNARDWWVGLANANTNKFTSQKWATWNLALNEQLADIQVGSSNGDSNADIFARREDGRWIALESTGTAFSTRTLTRWSSTANWQNVQIGRFFRPAIGAAAAPAAFTVESGSKPQKDTVNTSRWVSPKENTNSESRTIPKQQSVLVRSEEESSTEDYESFGSARFLDLLYSV